MNLEKPLMLSYEVRISWFFLYLWKKKLSEEIGMSMWQYLDEAVV